jgi:hypothetical protein
VASFGGLTGNNTTMKTKYVGETKAGKSISAWIVLNKRGVEIACIRSHYSDGGTCLVNVFNYGDEKTNKSAKTKGFQSGTAGGGGYDKFTSALSRMEIDGIKLGNHCEYSKKPPANGVWPKDFKAPKGWMLANYRESETIEVDGSFKRVPLPPEKCGFTSLYRLDGFKYLQAIGYRVIQAI